MMISHQRGVVIGGNVSMLTAVAAAVIPLQDEKCTLPPITDKVHRKLSTVYVPVC